MADAGIWIFSFIALWAVAVFAFVRGSRGREDGNTLTADPDGWCQPFAPFHYDDLPEFPGECARPSGWQPWEGGKCPVPDDVMVVVMLRSGFIDAACRADWYLWGNYEWNGDIVAYRLAD